MLAVIAGQRDLQNATESSRPATMIPLKQRSMMNVVPIAARQLENGEARDQIADNMCGNRERGHAVKRAPAARLAQNLCENP